MIALDSQQILDYLPHRDPMVMLDGAEMTVEPPVPLKGEECTVVYATLLVKETNWFFADGVLTESGLMEHMAQSVCVCIGLRANNEQLRTQIGYLAEVKNMTINRLPMAGEQLRTRVEVVALVDEAIVVSAETQVNTETIAKGMLTIFVPTVEEERRAQ